MPSVFQTFGFVVSGKKQPAAVMRPFCTMSAPSWIGDVGRKIDWMSSRDDAGVEARADLDVFVQADFALEDDEARPSASPARLAADTHDLFERLCVCHLVRPAGERRAGADLRQRATDVVLEDDDDHEDHRREKIVEHPVQRVELEVLRPEVGREHHEQPHQHLGRTRPADEVDHAVRDERDDRDVDDVLPAEDPEKAAHAAPQIASATRSARVIAATSWTRTMRAPAATARSEAATVPSTR